MYEALSKSLLTPVWSPNLKNVQLVKLPNPSYTVVSCELFILSQIHAPFTKLLYIMDISWSILSKKGSCLMLIFYYNEISPFRTSLLG